MTSFPEILLFFEHDGDEFDLDRRYFSLIEFLHDFH